MVGGTGYVCLVRGLPTWQENYLIQVKGELRLAGNFKVSQVNGVEGSSKECYVGTGGHGNRSLRSGGPDDLDLTHQVVLFGLELVHFHEFEEGEEGDDNLDLRGGLLEERLQGYSLAWSETGQEEFDLVIDGVAVIDDVTKIPGLFESFQDILEGSDEVENGNFSQGSWLKILGFRIFLGSESEDRFLFDLPAGEETGGILEFFVFNKLADQFPTGVVFVRFVPGRLFPLGEKSPALNIHQVGRHGDEFRGQIDVEKFEGLEVIEILGCDPFQRYVVNVHLVFPDEVKKQVQGALEYFQADFVVGKFHTGEIPKVTGYGE